MPVYHQEQYGTRTVPTRYTTATAPWVHHAPPAGSVVSTGGAARAVTEPWALFLKLCWVAGSWAPSLSLICLLPTVRFPLASRLFPDNKQKDRMRDGTPRLKQVCSSPDVPGS